jgi:hypothetical protein
VQNKVEAAYARSVLFERRRLLMDDWADYLAGEGRWCDPLEVARVLSAFVVRAETISDAVQAKIERGYKPIGPFFMALAQDGSVTIRWHAARDSKTYEKRIT